MIKEEGKIAKLAHLAKESTISFLFNPVCALIHLLNPHTLEG